MGWPFSKREYHTRKILGQSVWHSHTIEDGAATAVSYTPIGIIVDVASGNGADNPVVGGLYPPGEEEEPQDNRPTCNSYKITNQALLNGAQGAASLYSFNTTPDCQTPGTHASLNSWLLTKRDTFCNNVDNFAFNPGGGLCAEKNAGNDIAVEYCGEVGNDSVPNIKQLWCTREDLGPDDYAKLAAAYCQTDVGKADQWCSCYNVKEGVCDTDPNAAGCPEKALNFDPLVANTPDFFKPQWTGREGCFGAVCAESGGESKYLPVDETNVCASPINICGGGALTMENVTASTVNNKCTIGDNTFDPDTGELEDTDGNPVDNPNDDEDEDEGSFTDTNIMLGGGVASGSSLSSCLCIIILIVVMSSGKSGGGRFR
jgi:hypothetical protein